METQALNNSDNKNIPESLSNKGSLPAVSTQEIEAAQPHKHSFGTVAFFLLNDLGVNWVLNTAVSLFVTFNLSYHSKADSARNWYKERFTKQNELLPIDKRLSEGDIAKKAWHYVEVPLMMITGFFFVPPMKYLENHKKNIIAKLDHGWERITGHKQEASQPDPAAEEAKPRTWTDLIVSRLIALSFIKFVAMPLYSKADAKFNLDGSIEKVTRYDSMFVDGAPVLAAPVTEEVFHNGKLQNIGKAIINNKWLKKPATKFSEMIDRGIHEPSWTHKSPEHYREAVFSEHTKLITKETSLTLLFALFMSAASKGYEAVFGKKDVPSEPKKSSATTPRQHVDKYDFDGVTHSEKPSHAARLARPKEAPRQRSFEEMAHKQDQEAALA